MPDIITTLYGGMTFLGACVLSLILYYFTESGIMDLFTNSFLTGALYFFMFFVMAVCLVIAPIYITYVGKTEPTIVSGIATFVAMLGITGTMYYFGMVTSFIGLFDDPTIKTIVWVGVFTTIISSLVISPAMQIYEASAEGRIFG